ncbi:hypothetical protein C2E23DRAFT_382532 [Lenzites betulinus]|nr:hypothetical protein C2E23DRAFT_382532 [Lenzites betulinus]
MQIIRRAAIVFGFRLVGGGVRSVPSGSGMAADVTATSTPHPCSVLYCYVLAREDPRLCHPSDSLNVATGWRMHMDIAHHQLTGPGRHPRNV